MAWGVAYPTHLKKQNFKLSKTKLSNLLEVDQYSTNLHLTLNNFISWNWMIFSK